MILKSDIRSHLDASFVTMRKAEVYGIQSVRNSITLSKTQLDGAQYGYIYQELRTVEIPTDYNKRHKWLKVMDLMAVLLNMLEAQDEILKQLALNKMAKWRLGTIYRVIRDQIENIDGVRRISHNQMQIYSLKFCLFMLHTVRLSFRMVYVLMLSIIMPPLLTAKMRYPLPEFN
jgi:hypothetical protein